MYKKIHHLKAFNIKAYKDRTYKKLLDDKVRNKILKENSYREECNNSNMFDFLSLLQRENVTSSIIRYQEITTEES